MSDIKLYLNEDIQIVLAHALRKRGFNAVTTQEVNLTTSSDREQLEFASNDGRTVLTFNRGDFLQLHSQFSQQSIDHSGIIVSEQLPIGELLRRLTKLLTSLTAEEMRNRLVYLGQWK